MSREPSRFDRPSPRPTTRLGKQLFERQSLERIGRAALAVSVLFALIGTAAAGADARPDRNPPEGRARMCRDVPIGTPSIDVNGADTNFNWADTSLGWTTNGSADNRHFRVTIGTADDQETVWGETGSWNGAVIEWVQACHCPPQNSSPTTKPPSTSTTKPGTTTTKPITTTTKPTTTTTTWVTTTTTQTTTTSTIAPTTTSTTEPTTTTTWWDLTVPTQATTTTQPTATTVVPPTAGTTTTTTTIGAAPPTTAGSSPTTPGTSGSTTRPTLQVLSSGVSAQEALPETGLANSQMALLAAALLAAGGALLIAESRAGEAAGPADQRP